MPGGHDGGSGPAAPQWVAPGRVCILARPAALSAAAPSKLSMMATSSGVSLRRHSCSIQSGTGHRAAAIDAAMADVRHKDCGDGLGHGAPARHIPRVARPYLADGAAQVVAETVFHVSPYLAVAGPVARHEHRRGHGPGRPDGLGMVVRHRCRHRGQPQCLVEGGGIKPSRAHAHGRAVAPAAVGLGVVGGQPAGEGRPIACVGILAAQFLHGFNERGRALVAAVCQPPGHGERHHRVVGEAARGHEQRYLAWVAELQQARLIDRACHVSNYCS